MHIFCKVLFGDAAGCAVIARPSTRGKTDSQHQYLNMGAHYIPDTRHVLTIAVSEEEGLYYENSIKKELPVKLNATLASKFRIWQKSVLGDSIHPNDCAYAVHPGGKKLLQNFESLISDYGVKNADKELSNSYKNLRLYGNLASAAIIFILGDVSIYFMVMGPGVCLGMDYIQYLTVK